MKDKKDSLWALAVDDEDGPHYMIPVRSKGIKDDKKGPMFMIPGYPDLLDPNDSDGLIPDRSDD